MSLSLSNSLSFALIPLAKSLKSSKNSFFSDFGGLFLLVRGVCSKRSFSNFGFFFQEDFYETNLDLSKHPEQVFSIFSYFLNIFFWRKKIILVFGELRELCAKFWKFWVNIHREIICQSRLLLTPFFNFCIVHCCWLNWFHMCALCSTICFFKVRKFQTTLTAKGVWWTACRNAFERNTLHWVWENTVNTT